MNIGLGVKVGDLMQKIKEDHLASAERIRFLFRGHLLGEDVIISSLGIRPSDTIYVYTLPINQKFKLPEVKPAPVPKKSANAEPKRYNATINKLRSALLANPRDGMNRLQKLIAETNPELAEKVRRDPSKLLNIMGVKTTTQNGKCCLAPTSQ